MPSKRMAIRTIAPCTARSGELRRTASGAAAVSVAAAGRIALLRETDSARPESSSRRTVRQENRELKAELKRLRSERSRSGV